jgi:Cys-Gly metallodipeptidase DUG1
VALVESLVTRSIFLTCRAIYDSLDYTTADIEQSAGAPIALSSDKATVLMGRMRYPSLSLHGIEGAFHGVGAKTVIPAKVAGKFSIRCVDIITYS